MKRRYTGLTMVELITVVAIIALLMALLIPSVAAVRRLAKETQQKAQLTSIEMALEAFKIDHGYYPPSNADLSVTTNMYGGAQKLADALFGRDLVGFYPGMDWDAADPSAGISQDYINNSDPSQRSNLYLNKGIPYVFRCEQLFGGNNVAPLSNVICDVFGRWMVTRPDGKVVKAGLPILYFRANPINTDSTIIDIYLRSDNVDMVWEVYQKRQLSSQIINTNPFTATPNTGFYGDRTDSNPEGVYGYIQNPDIPTRVWPYNPDSFLLISAGQDGIYGNADDITNFR